jgi:hypothetical protein
METRSVGFRYHVSVRISHPDLEPELITARLGLAPTRLERKGEKKKTGYGTEKSPVREVMLERSEWFHMFEPVGDGSLDACLMNAIAKLKAQEEFLQWIHSNGGRVRICVILYPPRTCEKPFDYDLITELRRLGFGFRIEFHDRDG